MLTNLINEKKARVGVIGLGYVGLPLVIEFGRAGFSVTGFDIDQSKVTQLTQGKSYIRHIPEDAIRQLVEGGRFTATTDFSGIRDTDCLLICVPTPLTKNREPDMKYVADTARAMAPHLKKGQLISLESTTYPGTTREVLIPLLEKGSGLKADADFFVAYSPEREDPNNPDFNTRTIPKVVGADSPEGREAALALYDQVVEQTVPVSDTPTAEATKLMENIFRAVNIALVNELKVIFDRMGIDVWEVIRAASTKPFGYMPFYPGPGLGGHCIPIDPFYLTWKAREFGVTTRFIELAGEVNWQMPEYVVQRLMWMLNKHGIALAKSRLLILGMAYKKDVDDYRESPSLRIMEILKESGAEVDFHDPYVPRMGPSREYPQFAGMESVDIATIPDYDAVLILTNHSVFDYNTIVESARLVLDTRNACGDIQSDKITKA
ncbi:MAG: nucleotide sugar dehydrogenase [Nitrospina sp.]|nr:nucleotide sugar dehydrogenase [Nitrospina sp.]